jgi:hypothetical protein
MLLKSNVTYTLKLTNRYFFTALMLLIGILYTLRRGIVHAKRLTKASMMHVQASPNLRDDMDNFSQHLRQEGDQGGLF